MTSTYYAQSRPEVLPLLPPQPRRVLEVGCSEGRFAAQVQGQGCEVYWGIEPSATAAAVARERLDRVLVGTYDDAAPALPAAYFDLVVCNDVIEHMADHDGFLRAIQAHLVPGAWLVGSVPNVRYLPHLWQLLMQRDWAYTDAGILDRTHQRFFTQKSLRASLQASGWRVQRIVGLNSVIVASPWKGRVRWALTRRLLELATLRGQGDTPFLQIGFAARLGGGPAP